MINGGLRTQNIKKVSSQNKPLITVVTVVYNCKDTLEETIKSVINQTYDNIEYLIIDGASTDGTLDIIKKYEDKIDYWQSEPDKGIYDAMNKGVKLATGDYIALLNADDWYDKKTVENVVFEILNEKYDVYYGLIRIFNKDNYAIKVQGDCICNIKNAPIAHPTCFISKKIYENYLYDCSYKSAADYEFIIRIYDKATFKFIEKVLVNFRTGGMSSNWKSFIESSLIQFKYGFIDKKHYFIKVIYYKLRGLIK